MRALPEPDYGPVPLNPGIVKTVALLREHGFETTDSGDGETHVAEDDQTPGYVHIVSSPEVMVAEAQAVTALLERAGVRVDAMGPEDSNTVSVQCTYDVGSGTASVLVVGIHDRLLTETLPASVSGSMPAFLLEEPAQHGEDGP